MRNSNFLEIFGRTLDLHCRGLLSRRISTVLAMLFEFPKQGYSTVNVAAEASEAFIEVIMILAEHLKANPSRYILPGGE